METTIQFYDVGRHHDSLCAWMRAHKLPEPEPHILSDVGLIINNCAIGFLFKTNSKTCYIDNIVTNPLKKSGERHEALNMLLKNLDWMARKSGFEVITILTNTPEMDKRVGELGYKNHGAFSLFGKETGGI